MTEGHRGKETENGEYPQKEITEAIIASAITVQRVLGPGLLESTYEICLAHELRKNGHQVSTQVTLDITYDDLLISNAYRMDMLVDNAVVVELKTVDKLIELHHAQLFSYLRFSEKEVGLLLNFWAWPLKEGGIKRVIRSHSSL